MVRASQSVEFEGALREQGHTEWGFGSGVAGKEHLYDSSSKPGTEEWSGVGEVCFARVGHDFVDDKWV